MSIDWNATIKTWDDKDYKESNAPDAKPATLRFLACQAVDAGLQQDQSLAKGEKKDRHYLMKKLKRKDVGELSNKDMELIKSRIEAAYPSSWIVGECLDLLNGSNGEAPKE